MQDNVKNAADGEVITNGDFTYVTLARGIVKAFGGDQSSPWVDYGQIKPMNIEVRFVLKMIHFPDEEPDFEYEFEIYCLFETYRPAGMEEHPYADEQFLQDSIALLTEAGIPANDSDFMFSEQGAQNKAFAHFDIEGDMLETIVDKFKLKG